jgi:hypothetical protein
MSRFYDPTEYLRRQLFQPAPATPQAAPQFAAPVQPRGGRLPLAPAGGPMAGGYQPLDPRLTNEDLAAAVRAANATAPPLPTRTPTQMMTRQPEVLPQTAPGQAIQPSQTYPPLGAHQGPPPQAQPIPTAPMPQPAASPLAAALQPGGERTFTIRGFSPSRQAFDVAEYRADANDRVTGGTFNGTAFDGTPQALAALQQRAAQEQGQRETGVAGVPSLSSLSQMIAGTGMGGSPALDQQRMLLAQQTQLQLADTNSRMQAAGLRKAPQDRLMDMADAVFAQTLQKTGNGAQAQLEREKFLSNAASSNQDLAAAGVPVRGGMRLGLAGGPGAGGTLQQRAADTDAASAFVTAIRGAAVGPDGRPRAEFGAEALRQALTGLDANALSRPGVAAEIGRTLTAGDSAIPAARLQDELARVVAQNYLAQNYAGPARGIGLGPTGPTLRNTVPNPSIPGTDLRLEGMRTMFGRVADRVTGGSGYNYIRMPDGRLVELGPTDGSFSGTIRNRAESDRLLQQQTVAASLLRELLAAQQQGVR